MSDVLFNAEGVRSRTATLLSLRDISPIRESPSTKPLRGFAYGTAQDDKGAAGAHMGAPLRIIINVCALHWGPVAGRQPFCRYATFPLSGESPSTILLRKIAYGTAQDDSRRQRLTANVSAN